MSNVIQVTEREFVTIEVDTTNDTPTITKAEDVSYSGLEGVLDVQSAIDELYEKIALLEGAE